MRTGVEDNIPEDQSLVLNAPQGLVVVTGCGHAGIVNILTDVIQAALDPRIRMGGR